jgi:hypothetical protein
VSRLLLFGFLLSQVTLLEAQVNRKTFPLSREFKKTGFSIAPLATVSFGNKKDDLSFSNTPEVEYNYTETGRGTWNAGLELGYLKFIEVYKIGDYFEAAISYRRFSGVHYLEGKVVRSPSGTSNSFSTELENSWEYQTITAAFRVIDIAWQKPKGFITWGLGVNYDYRIADEVDSDFPEGYVTDQPFENKHALRAHFQLGYAFKMSKHLLFIPTLETPLVSILPTGNLKPSIQFLNVNYQPLIISLKFMILRKDPVNCNAPRLKNMPTM